MKGKGALLLLGKPEEDEEEAPSSSKEPVSDDGGDPEMDAAADVVAAIKSGDSEGAASALVDLVKLCTSKEY